MSHNTEWTNPANSSIAGNASTAYATPINLPGPMYVRALAIFASAGAAGVVFEDLPSAVRLVDRPELTREAFAIAAVEGGSVYDATYIALARNMAAPLLSDDARMRTVAARVGVKAIPLADG